MNRILWSLAVGIVLTVWTSRADDLSPLGPAANVYGAQLAQQQSVRDMLATLRANGKDDQAILNSLCDWIFDQREAQKEGITSSSDVALFVVLAGAECAYQLGYTPRHPPGFNASTLDPVAIKDAPATSKLVVKITGNRWESYETNDSGHLTKSNKLFVSGTLTNTSAVSVTITKMVARGYGKNQTVLVNGSDYTIGNAEIVSGDTVIFKMVLADAQKAVRFVVVTPYVAQP
jgi:hypothetical protein